DSNYSNGGEQMFQRSNVACERALALDPNLIAAQEQLITNHVERREKKKTYDEAQTFVQRPPGNAVAPFPFGDVLPYARILQESTRECDIALSLDRNWQFRSCAWSFGYSGKPERGMDFVRLDAGSEWAAWATAHMLLRQGKLGATREAVKSMAPNPRYHRDLLE